MLISKIFVIISVSVAGHIKDLENGTVDDTVNEIY